MCCGKDDLELGRIGERSTDDGMDRREFLKKLGVGGGALAAGGLLLSKADYLGQTAMAQQPLALRVGDKWGYSASYRALDGTGRVIESLTQDLSYAVKAMRGTIVIFDTNDIFPPPAPPADPTARIALTEHIVDTGKNQLLQVGGVDVSRDGLLWPLFAQSLTPGTQIPFLKMPGTAGAPIPLQIGRQAFTTVPVTATIKDELLQANITSFYDQRSGWLVRQSSELNLVGVGLQRAVADGSAKIIVEMNAVSLPGGSPFAWGGASGPDNVGLGSVVNAPGILFQPDDHGPSGSTKCFRKCMGMTWWMIATILAAIASCCLIVAPACIACWAAILGAGLAAQIAFCKQHCKY